MDINELESELTLFLKENIPLVCLNEDLHIVVRKGLLQIFKSNKLAIGDVRMLSLPAVDLVKGLSADQWSTLFQKCITLFAYADRVLQQRDLIENRELN